MEKIDQVSLEIKKLLQEETVNHKLVSNKVKDLEQAVLDANWYSRKCDEIDDPIEELMSHKFYKEALAIILAIKEKEFCSMDMGYYDSKAGICYFELKDYQNAELYFYKAICDDEDWMDELLPYIEQLRNNPDFALTFF